MYKEGMCPKKSSKALYTVLCVFTIVLLVFVMPTFSLSAFGQAKFSETKNTNGVDKIIKKIEEVNIVMNDAVGYSAVRPEQYDNFINLKSKATKDELIELTNHSNATIRCYAFWALSYNYTVDLFPIVLKHINDSENVSTQFGCIGSSEKVGDFFINVVTPEYLDLNSKKLNSAQLEKLDNILIYTPNELRAKDSALMRVNPTKDLYPRIRELVVKDKNQTALVILAKYQNKQDVELILNNREDSKFEDSGFFNTYRAIGFFPHPDFFPLLEKNLKATLDNTHFSNEWQELYKAIASYKNKKALDLLQVPFTQVKYDNIRGYHIDFIFKALQESKAPIYDDLLWKLWGEEDRITLDIFKYLYGKNPEKAFEYTKKSLQHLYEFNYIGEKDLINAMFDLTLKLDSDFALEIIRKNIREMNVHLFPIFADKATEIKDNSFIEPLFERFEKEPNPHIYLAIAKTLISYKDKKINQRILEVREKNENLKKGWGTESLDKLLEENLIK